MLSKSISVALFFAVLASMSYGCSVTETQLQDPAYGKSLSGVQAVALADAPILSPCNNIALGKVTNASANSALSGQAVDGNLATLWNAGALPTQWIEIDLGGLYTVDEIRAYVAQSPDGNTTHEIWVADSSKVYRMVETISGNTVNGQILNRVYSPGLTSVQWIKIITTASPSWVAWWEIQVCLPPSPTDTPTNTPTDTPMPSVCNNIALGKVTNASANTAQSGQAVDGNPATLWNAGALPTQWIEIDLGSPASVDEIRAYVAQFPDGNTTHEIWVADSSKVYTMVEAISGNTVNGQILNRVYNPALTSVQWIKIITTTSPSWVAWWEIQVCLTPSPVNTPTNTPTFTPTGTLTNTPTNTLTPTYTPTNTPIFTATDTPTNTPTNKPADTPTDTPTDAPTIAPTQTPLTNTPGKITGGGNIDPENGNAKATFGFIVSYDQGDSAPRGNLTYIDHETDMRISTESFDLLVIKGTHARFTGTAIVNGTQKVRFEVEIDDLSKLGSSDVFKISIPDYTAGGALTGGNIVIH